MDYTVLECDACRNTPGNPALCNICQKNRRVMNNANKTIKDLRDKIRIIRFTIGLGDQW